MADIQTLIEIMARLRDPERGCPWDREQSFASIAPYTLEEAYEVEQAIADGDMPALRDELGDLLFQVVYHARLAEETGHFKFEEVVEGICEKLIRRHPHVFGQGEVADAEEQTRAWEEFKAAERRRRAGVEGRSPSALDGIPAALPALARAAKLRRRMERAGGGEAEEDAGELMKRVLERVESGQASTGSRKSAAPDQASAEIGRLLLACAGLAVRLGVDPELALRRAGREVESRFRQWETTRGRDG
jgi:ATP diphosphatase